MSLLHDGLHYIIMPVKYACMRVAARSENRNNFNELPISHLTNTRWYCSNVHVKVNTYVMYSYLNTVLTMCNIWPRSSAWSSAYNNWIKTITRKTDSSLTDIDLFDWCLHKFSSIPPEDWWDATFNRDPGPYFPIPFNARVTVKVHHFSDFWESLLPINVNSLK